jgi:hypothetical protein
MITIQQCDSSNGVDNSDDDDNSILYFNVLTRQLQSQHKMTISVQNMPMLNQILAK